MNARLSWPNEFVASSTRPEVFRVWRGRVRSESRGLPASSWLLLRSCVVSVAVASVVLATLLFAMENPRVLRVFYAVGSAQLPAHALNAAAAGGVVSER